MNRRTLLAACLSALLLGACVGKAPRDAEIAQYDLGSFAGNPAPHGFPLVTIEVKAGTALASPAQLYRLVYADDLRRHAYAESRWAAPPAELLERALQRQLVFGQPDFGGPGCRLQLALDEFEQRFTAAQSSQTVLAVRASLLPGRGDALARRAFTMTQPAPSADARGGVMAARLAVQDLSGELGRWLAEVARERPQVVAACKGN